MKKLLFSVILALCALGASAQAGYTWHDPLNAGFPVLQGQAFPEECRDTYHRFPESRHSQVPDWVWGNALCSAGISLRFHTLSPEVCIRYITGNRHYAMDHMPAMGVSGVDMYEVDAKGKTYYCAPEYAFGDTVTFIFRALFHPNGGDYEVYLPLYNHVNWMNIGVPEGQDFQFLEASHEKPIVVYGTSIAHGGCASRTGMAWPTIIKRTLNRPVINWGFSGSGRLDSTMFVQMKQVDAALYIIDCIPNMTSHPDRVFDRMTKGVKMVREVTDTPILIVEHDGFTGEEVQPNRHEEYTKANKECRRAYEQLKKEHVKNLYYLSHEEIGMPMDALVDGCHSTDYGMMVYAKAYLKKLKKILK